MTEHAFAALRHQVETEGTRPSFEVIRGRRRRRTQRAAIACAALACLVLLTGATMTLGTAHGYGPAPAATPTASQDPQHARRYSISGLTATPSGTLYGLSRACTGDCRQAGPEYLYSLVRSTDLGATWSLVGDVPGTDAAFGAWLLAADDTHLWAINGSRVLLTADGGSTWQSRHLAPSPQFSEGIGPAAQAGDAIWVSLNGRAFRATFTEPLTPSPLTGIRRLAAASADQAYALVDGGVWYVTSDRGTTWSKLAADPCAGTPYAGSMASTMSVARDGTQWVVCAAEQPSTGLQQPAEPPTQQPKELAISTDGGRTWQRHALESAGDGVTVYPISGTVAWRVGSFTHIRRTTDDTQWIDVARPRGQLADGPLRRHRREHGVVRPVRAGRPPGTRVPDP